MDPNKEFIKQMCFVYKKVGPTNFNEPIFSKILDNEVQKKFIIIKEHLKSDLFQAVIDFEKNRKVRKILVKCNEQISEIIQSEKITKDKLIKIGISIDRFYAAFFDLNIVEYIELMRKFYSNQ